METLEQIKARIEAAVSGAKLEIIANDSPSAQRSLLLDREHALAVAEFLCADAELCLDYCSNMLHMFFAVPCEPYEVDPVSPDRIFMGFPAERPAKGWAAWNEPEEK